MKNFLKKAIFPVIIGILFFSTIIAFIFMLFSYHKSLLKSVGIYINDDCKFSSINKLTCSYIEVSDRNSFFFNLKDVSIDIAYKKLIKGEKGLKIYIDKVDGRVKPKKEEKKGKKQINLKPVFYGLN
ncbi:MAG: hypothetical protein GXO21_03545, partial [Aquificae bacterium]|nr:hypothetical protein [Aquificota bacterium]